MLKLELFKHRNFRVGNLETLGMYAGLGIFFFYLTIYLQQVAGYTALQSGLATVPLTIVMFLLSRRFGALADRFGPRVFMAAGPLIAAAGLLPLLHVGENVSYLTELFPGLLVFALGLSITVAPLTATVLADADQGDAGIASAVNNSVARIASLIGVSVVGIVVAGTLVGDTFAANSESVSAFHQVIAICVLLLAAGGVAGAIGIVDPKRPVNARGCAGGQLVGAPEPAAQLESPT
jgi:predicted MFS family arabinose efflux permease